MSETDGTFGGQAVTPLSVALVCVALFVIGMVLPKGVAPASGSRPEPTPATADADALHTPADVRGDTALPPSRAVALPTDHFDREPSHGLGKGLYGAWTAWTGGWSVRDGRAVAEGKKGVNQLATVEGPGPSQVVSARLDGFDDQTGVAFRVKGPRDYLAFVVYRQFAQGVVLESSGGRFRRIATTGMLPVRPGMQLGVRAVGDEVQLLVDDKVVGTLKTSATGGGAGLFTSGTGKGASFDDFSAESP